MKQYYILIVIGTLLSACSGTKPITVSHANITAKDEVMICNNSNYSISSIVGIGAEAITYEQDYLKKKRFDARVQALKNINGLALTTYKDANGVEQIKAIAQNDILFNFDSFELSSQAQTMLNQLCVVINEIPNTKVNIIGHTDNVGDKNYNMVLSKNRALSVGNYMRSSGVDGDNITEDGKGLSSPIADNKTESGRAKNRRVEIYISTPNEL